MRWNVYRDYDGKTIRLTSSIQDAIMDAWVISEREARGVVVEEVPTEWQHEWVKITFTRVFRDRKE